MKTLRGPTSREFLTVDWLYPVYTDQGADAEGRTRAKARSDALVREAAFAFVAEDDQRPLLVLRECLTCNGTDDALLTRQADNEKTFLLSHWFRCVKLPPDVLAEDHALHALFPGDDPPHLFVSHANGDALRPLNGAQSRRELWGVMTDTLETQYRDDHRRPLKELTKLLERFDLLDIKLQRARERIDREIESSGPSSRKLRGLRRDLENLEQDRDILLRKQRELIGLELALETEETDDRG